MDSATLKPEVTRPEKEIMPDQPNTERPPGDWQVTNPEEYPEQNEPGIEDPRKETEGPEIDIPKTVAGTVGATVNQPLLND